MAATVTLLAAMLNLQRQRVGLQRRSCGLTAKIGKIVSCCDSGRQRYDGSEDSAPHTLKITPTVGVRVLTTARQSFDRTQRRV